MYKKLIFTSVLLISTLFITTSVNAAEEACVIESVAIRELVDYTRSVDLRIRELQKEATRQSNCGVSSRGSIAGAERTAKIVDRAFINAPIFDGSLLDFEFNILLAARSESRAPVTRDAQLFVQVDKKINAAITSIANQCNLEGSVENGFIVLLQQNQSLENIYKQAAIGKPNFSLSGLSPENIIIAKSINDNYIPPKTAACKDQTGTAQAIDKLNKAIEKTGAKNESALKDWRIALALLGGGNTNNSIPERAIDKRRILQQELSRQGFSPRMSQAMLSNYDCIKANNPDGSMEGAVRARETCPINVVQGLENVTLLPIKNRIQNAKNITERQDAVDELGRVRNFQQDILLMANNLNSIKAPNIDTKTALMSNLIDLHLGLISTSEEVEARLRPMYTNCMKAQPVIPCPKP